MGRRRALLLPISDKGAILSIWITVSVSLGIFVITHIGVTIWWASRVTVLLDVVQKELKEISSELKSFHRLAMPKEIAEKEHRAMWSKIDFLMEKMSKL